MNSKELLAIPPYSYGHLEKKKLFDQELTALSQYHYDKCDEYKKIVDALGITLTDCMDYEKLPFLPVRLFKDFMLRSIDEDEIFRTMTSSGTTSQAVSKIFLDRETAAMQQKTLVKIVKDFTGSGRLPMIILDCPSVLKKRESFSARGAGILGFSIFASDRIYAMDDNMNLDWNGLSAFMEKHKGKTILLFGFTFMIWKYFYQELAKQPGKLNFEQGVLIHGGGWKKLKNQSVSPEAFREELKRVCGIKKVYDYYGMVEQTGSIYMECECGHLHTSVFSDVLVRRTKDYSLCDVQETGVIQVVSLLPHSYPGHSLLTEDMGVILGEDDCSCGRKGKYFKVLGRMKNAEVRGCSDTFQR